MAHPHQENLLVLGAAALPLDLVFPEVFRPDEDVYKRQNGNTVRQVTMKATEGANTWTWNGSNASGQTEPDGAYTVSVTSASGATAVPFTVVGTATGVTTTNGNINLQLGAVSVPFSDVTSVANGSLSLIHI